LTGAVIGVGRMGRRHVRSLTDLGLEVVGICDPKTESLQLTEVELGVPERRHYADPKAMLRDTRPECVVVSSTADSHCDLTCLAAQHGAKYILCEKPMACSIAQCDEMIAACQNAGAHLSINHPMRFMSYYVEPKRIMASEDFGGMTSMTVVGGNFGLAMNGTHYFEAFRFLTGEEPKEVTAWLSDVCVPNPRGPQFEDRGGSVRVTTGSGKRLYIEAWPDQGHRINVAYAGPFGQLVVDELAGSMAMTVREAEHRSQPTTRYGMPSIDKSKTAEPIDADLLYRTAIKSLLDGADYPTAQQGKLAVRALVAAHISHARGNVSVDFNDETIPADRMFAWA